MPRNTIKRYSHSIIAGDVLLTTKPHVSVLSNDHLEGNCSNCFMSGTALRRCTGCTTLFYCSVVGNRVLNPAILLIHLYCNYRNAKKRIGLCTNKSVQLSRNGPLPPRPSLAMPFGVLEECSGRKGNLER